MRAICAETEGRGDDNDSKPEATSNVNVVTPPLGDTSCPRERDYSVDCFRFVGMILIVMRHVRAWDYLSGSLLSEVICFNVVMVIMGCVLGTRLSRTPRAYPAYLWMKIKGIYFPAIIHASCCYTIAYLLGSTNLSLIAPHLILGGYFWFIRGYLIIYVLTPWVKRLNEEVKSHKKYFLFCFFLVVVSEGFRILVQDYRLPPRPVRLFSHWYIFPTYSFPLCFLILYRTPILNRREYWGLWLIMVGFFASIYVYHKAGNYPVNPNYYKSPMSITYSLYGMIMTMVLYAFLPYISKFIQFLGLLDVAQFISSHSLWFYMHHTLFADVFCFTDTPFFVLFVMVACTYCTTKMQSSIVSRIAANIKSPTIASNVRMIFGA